MPNVYTNQINEYLQSTKRRPDTDYQARLKQAQRVNTIAQIMNLVGQGIYAGKGANVLPMQDKVTPFTMNEFARIREDEIRQGDEERRIGLTGLMKDIEYGLREKERGEEKEYRTSRDTEALEKYREYNETPAEREARESRMYDKRYQMAKKEALLNAKPTEYYQPGTIDWILSDKNRVNRYYSLVTSDPKFKARFDNEYAAVAQKLNMLGEDVSDQFKMAVIRKFHPEIHPEFYIKEKDTEDVKQARNYPGNYFEKTLGRTTSPPGWHTGMRLPEKTTQFNPNDPVTKRVLSWAMDKANAIIETDYRRKHGAKADEIKEKEFYNVFKNVPGITKEHIDSFWEITKSSEPDNEFYENDPKIKERLSKAWRKANELLSPDYVIPLVNRKDPDGFKKKKFYWIFKEYVKDIPDEVIDRYWEQATGKR